MHLGIDLGTTRTVVAHADRGNYPVVSFTDHFGDAVEHVPSVVADLGGTLVHGFDAVEAAESGAPSLRSFKRILADPGIGPHTPVRVGSVDTTILDLITGFLRALLIALRTRSNVGPQLATEGLASCAIAVPAHASGVQRYLTLEAFTRAGFEVAAVVNEPSAAGFEYTHRQARTLNSRRTRIVVYDLGGGTFDASLVKVDQTAHEVVASLGVNRLGGDDFDAVLADLVLRQLGTTRAQLGAGAYATLLDDCREAKEHLSPQSKRMTLDVGAEAVAVHVDDFYAAAGGLVEKSLQTMAPLLGGHDHDSPDLTDIAGIYLVGGASCLPLIPRRLRETFGRRVHRSPYPAASTAIGLAIAADPDAGYSLKDRLARGFGVFREGDSGAQVRFDPIFTRDDTFASGRTTTVVRRYRAAHNIGWFRFVEFADLDRRGQPSGDITPFGEIVFPFTPGLQGVDLPRNVVVERLGDGPLIEESYVVDAGGVVQARISDLDTGFTMSRSLG